MMDCTSTSTPMPNKLFPHQWNMREQGLLVCEGPVLPRGGVRAACEGVALERWEREFGKYHVGRILDLLSTFALRLCLPLCLGTLLLLLGMLLLALVS